MNKLTYRNNWEVDEYYINGKRVENLFSVEIDNKTYEVFSKVISVPYSDHGHTYNGVSTHYFINTEVFGITQTFDLNTLVNKVNIKAVEFQTVKDSK